MTSTNLVNTPRKRQRNLTTIKEFINLTFEHNVVEKTRSGFNTTTLVFKGLRHWTYSNPKDIDEEISYIVSLWHDDETIGIWFNPEFVIDVLFRGVSKEVIKFYADCQWKADVVMSLGLLSDNVEVMKKKYKEKEKKELENSSTYTLTNIPFDEYGEFTKIIKLVTQKKAVMIAKRSDFKRPKSFDNVVRYRALPKDSFPGMEVPTSVVVMDYENPSDTITFVGDDGEKTIKRNDFDNSPPGHSISGVGNQPKFEGLQFYRPKTNKGLKDPIQSNEGGKNYIYRSGYSNDKSGIRIIVGSGVPSVIKSYDDLIDENNFEPDDGSMNWRTQLWRYIPNNLLDDSDGHKVNKVVFSNISSSAGKLTNLVFVPKGIATARSTLFIKVEDEIEADYAVMYWHHAETQAWYALHGNPATKKVDVGVKKMPHHKEAHKWIKEKDFESYDDYRKRRIAAS